MKKLSFILLAFFMFISFQNYAQTLKGVIVDESNGQSIPGATIFVEGSNVGTVSDLDGNFSFKVPVGTNNLHVSSMGYTELVKNYTISASQDLDLGELTLTSNAIGLDEVKVIASYATNRKTPVALSNIEPAYIDEKLGTQEFPEILKTTPSVYATKQSGGYGDSRINVRGFDSRNVGILINGVPVNDMENGTVYWSNWAGLSDVTRTIQVQRGIGASRLAISSIGGTINILTKTTDMKKGGTISYGLGNNGYNKTAFTVSTGLLDNGWAVTVSGSHTKGDGYILQTGFEAWSYYFNASKRFSSKNQISFNVFGAPQWHNQRSSSYLIQTYRDDPNGTKLNWGYGSLNGELFNGDYGQNYYHKPVFSLNHFWNISDNLSVNTVAYASFGRGGRRVVYGPQSTLLRFTYPGGMPYAETLQTPGGLLDYDSVQTINQQSLTGSQAIFSTIYNSHNWYGVLSTLKYDLNNISITGGFDGRYYKGFHYQRIDDLLGGKYFLDSKNVNRAPGTPLYVGDTVNYSYIGEVLWAGLFSQIEYSKDKLSAFASFATSYSNSRRLDYYTYTPQDTAPGQVSIWRPFLTYSIKGGVNYNISDKFNVFVNGGYFTRPPFISYMFVKYQNTPIDSIKPERVLTFETGIGYTSGKFTTNLYGYYTKWMDKSITKALGGVTAYITGLEANHKGLEWVAKLQLNKKLDLGFMASVGDWKWGNDVNAEVYDENQTLIGSLFVYTSGIHVSNAAQTTGAITFDYEILPSLKIGIDWTYYDRLYADFLIENRTSALDKGVDAWRMPSYNLTDFSASYRFDLGPYKASLYGNINNLFDIQYLADGTDGNSHDAFTSYVYYGFGRTWSLTLNIKF